MPFNIRDAVKTELKEMLDLDVIEESDSPYCSPAFALKKKMVQLEFVTILELSTQSLKAMAIHAPI